MEPPLLALLMQLPAEARRAAARYYRALADRLDHDASAEESRRQALERLAEHRRRFEASGESAAATELAGTPRSQAIEAAAARFGLRPEAVALAHRDAMARARLRLRQDREVEIMRLAPAAAGRTRRLPAGLACRPRRSPGPFEGSAMKEPARLAYFLIIATLALLILAIWTDPVLRRATQPPASVPFHSAAPVLPSPAMLRPSSAGGKIRLASEVNEPSAGGVVLALAGVAGAGLFKRK